MVTEANRIIFVFIWKGKDKVKRVSLVGDIKDGGLKAPHLESIIKTNRIMLCHSRDSWTKNLVIGKIFYVTI